MNNPKEQLVEARRLLHTGDPLGAWKAATEYLQWRSGGCYEPVITVTSFGETASYRGDEFARAIITNSHAESPYWPMLLTADILDA